jgi:hypothetical protein
MGVGRRPLDRFQQKQTPVFRQKAVYTFESARFQRPLDGLDYVENARGEVEARGLSAMLVGRHGRSGASPAAVGLRARRQDALARRWGQSV